LRDLRDAVRSLANTPGLSAIIVVSLALGTGANAAVYSAVDALLFRPPAGVAQPETLVEVYTSQVSGATYGASSYADYRSFSALPRMESAAAIDERNETTIRIGDDAVNGRPAAVSDNFWDVLRVRLPHGEWAGDPNQPNVAIISFDLWQSFGHDPRILGRTILVGGQPYVVAGVAPARFRGTHLDRVIDVWIPLEKSAVDSGRGTRRLKVIGRLTSGTTAGQLQESLDATSRTLAETYPETNKGTIRSADEPRRFTAISYSRLDPSIRSQAGLLAAILFGATCLLLLSACVNAGSLLLSRGIARRLELTIKTALGAHRAMLIRQLLIEALLLAIAGAAAGALAAAWTAGIIPALFAPEHANLLDTRVHPAVVAITLGIGAVAGIVFGLTPAIVSTRSLSADMLRGDPARIGERHAGSRLRMTLVGAQLALSTIFLIESALLTKTLDAALTTDRSPFAGSLVIGSIESFDPGYRDAAVERLRRSQVITRVAWVAVPPLARASRREFRIEHGATTEFAEFDINFASPDYFAMMRLPIIEGRLFGQKDDAEQRTVAVVNEALEQRYFPQRAQGRVLTAADGTSVEIVGVVRTKSFRAFEGSPQPMVYYPMTRATARGFYAVVRAPDDSTEVAHELGSALRSIPNLRKLDVFTFDAHLSRALATDRMIVTLVAACGILALGLAMVGVYGVMTDLVRRRTRDIGLRMALGANSWQILRLFVGSTLSPAFIGVFFGLLGAAWLLQIARSLVYGLASIDAALALLVVAGLSLVIFAAVLPPARRALRISPLLALREH
jgi:predicted permease